MRVAVFYVWVPTRAFGAHTAAFAKAWRAHQPGIDCELIALCKADLVPHSTPNMALSQCIAVGEHGFDLGPFIAQAPRFCEYDRLVLCGSYARPLIDGWLQRLCAAGPFAGATASYEAQPHLRTTAIAIEPSLLDGVRVPQTKTDCYELEHGGACLTARAKARGITPMLVGRDGAYPPEQWASARTYCAAEQENLICADNHTDAYRDADPARRAELAQRTWGEQAGGPTSAALAPVTVLTVSIPGREAWLAQNVASVYAQTVAVQRQLICAHTPPPVGAMVHYSQAKNDLLQAVRSEWVAVLNDDDLWLPHHLATIAGELQRSDVVYSWDAGGTRPREDANRWSAAQLLARLGQSNFLDGNCAIRTSALRDVGGFPTDWAGPEGGGRYADSPATFEDWELWRRLAKTGARFRCVPQETWRYGTSAKGRLSA